MAIRLGPSLPTVPIQKPIPLTKDELAKLFLGNDKAIVAEGNVVRVEAFGELHQTRFMIQSNGIYPERVALNSKVVILLVEE
jgi:hypothetical protein